uniref:Dual specificity protein phosphatase n=1 Tax=Sinocyclocheilus grahami TaxID=75366 RepID=A0A672PYG0_SINGR
MLRLDECFLHWTPVSEVWPNVFTGNEETAMDRVRLKEMGVTHILNTAVNTGAKYYKGMNITYYGVPVMDDHLFHISKYFLPAAKFIHKALSNPENKVLLHCTDGIFI